MLRLDNFPARGALRLMRCDPLRHLVIARLRRREIEPRRRKRGDEALGVPALARARAADDECKPGAARARAGHRGSAAGHKPTTSAARPTTMIRAPATRGAHVVRRASSRRVNSATPTASALWI